MQSNDRFIGRVRELAQLELAIGPGTDGLRLAMLSGPSGLGKTTLSSMAATAASDNGFRVATVHGRAGSLSTPFAPFIEAMPEFEVLLSVLAGDQSIDIEHAGIGLVNLLIQLVEGTPLLLLFDDAQALDESSLALLPYVVGISERANISVLFVEQTDAIGVPDSYRSFIDGMLARRVVNHLRLEPLDEEATRELVAHVLGLEDATEAPQEIVQRSGGNPWFAKELADAWRRGVTDVPSNIAAAATSRLYSLDDIGQDIVSAVALCSEGAHIGWLETLSGQRPRQFVRTMESISSSGLVREDGDIVSIAHPLMQQALVDELSNAMRRAIHLELAGAIEQVQLTETISARARAHHLAAAGRSDDAVALFLAAAEANFVGGQLHEAYADLCHALATEGRVDAQIDLLRRAATVAMQLGLQSAIAHWTELGRVAAATGNDELYAYSLYQQYWACNDGSANERLQRAASLGSETFGWSARAAATLARMQGDFVEAARLDTLAIDIAREGGDAQLEALALAKLAGSEAETGQTTKAVATYRDAVRRAISARMHDWAILAWGDLVMTLLDNLETRVAVEEIDAAIQYANDLALERSMPVLCAWRAQALAWNGQLDAASEDVDRALQLDLQYQRHGAYRNDHWSVLIRVIQTTIANDLGRGDALQLVEAATTLSTTLGFASWQHELSFERVRGSYRTSGIGAALVELDHFDTTAEPHLGAIAATWLARVSTIEGSAEGLDRARSIRESLADSPSTNLLAIHFAELDALFSVADGAALTELASMSTRWLEVDRPLEALWVQLVHGTLELARGDRDAARLLLDAARKGFNECGASAEADRAAALMRQTGARSRAKSRTTNVGPLTKRELEIARLVASGLKNSEVAASLFLAEKTVAAHLSNIYGKVEVKSRVQLTQWIRENDPEFDTAMAG